MNTKKESGRERIIWENSLAFFGAITASVSHELNNVMSIIDQNNGLLSDLLTAVEYGKPISNERLRKISDSLANQTERGVRIIKRLNMFAHSVDDPVREFDLVQLVENFIRLAQRLASLRKVNLKASYDKESLMVTNSPFLIQQVLFICIQRSLGSSQAEDTIGIQVYDSDSIVRIEVRGRQNPLNEEGWNSEYISQLMELIRGKLQIQSEGESETIEISLSK